MVYILEMLVLHTHKEMEILNSSHSIWRWSCLSCFIYFFLLNTFRGITNSFEVYVLFFCALYDVYTVHLYFLIKRVYMIMKMWLQYCRWWGQASRRWTFKVTVGEQQMLFIGLWCWGICLGWPGNTSRWKESSMYRCWGNSILQNISS